LAYHSVSGWCMDEKCAIPDRIKAGHALVAVVLSVLLTVVFLYMPGMFHNLLLSYISPTVVIMAVSYVVIFSKLRVDGFGQKVIRFFSPAAFGVYLIHVHTVVWKYFMKNRFAQIADSAPWMIPFKVIGSAVAVFTVCILMERLRIWLFQLLKVEQGIHKITDFKI